MNNLIAATLYNILYATSAVLYFKKCKTIYFMQMIIIQTSSCYQRRKYGHPRGCEYILSDSRLGRGRSIQYVCTLKHKIWNFIDFMLYGCLSMIVLKLYVFTCWSYYLKTYATNGNTTIQYVVHFTD